MVGTDQIRNAKHKLGPTDPNGMRVKSGGKVSVWS